MLSKQINNYKATLAQYLPTTAIESIFQFLTQDNHVLLRITRPRLSKLGDYRHPQPHHRYHEITINNNLNPYNFLRVLLHEMAHLNCWKKFANTVRPHGHEWQEEYRLLLQQYIAHFPFDVATLINQYIKRIPLNRHIAEQIDIQLRHYDPDYSAQEELTLNQLPTGSCFQIIGNKRGITFRSLEKRRTRYLCEDIHTGQRYLVTGRTLTKVLS